MQRIIRIEHMSVLRDGRPNGPYGSNAFRRAEHPDTHEYCNSPECIHTFSLEMCWDGGHRRPSPQDDRLGHGIRDDEMFGFQNVEQMRDWFTGWMSKLDRLGFVAAVYQVPNKKTRHGGRQSIFSWTEAKRIGDAPIMNYKAISQMLDNN